MIPLEIDFHPAAIKEGRKAFRWYLKRSATAAARFQEAFEAALEQISRTPQQWPVYSHNTRGRLLRRFPFVVVYRQRGTRLQVVAVAHGSRRPGYWKKRLGDTG
jgi:plasmid stabilization system protein ParE